MPWWGWLTISILGLISIIAVTGLGYLLNLLQHIFDGWYW